MGTITYYTPEEIFQKFIDFAKPNTLSKKTHLRYRALISLIYISDQRISDIIKIKKEQFNFKEEKEFVFKTEMYANKKSKRQYLNEERTKELTKRFNAFFRSKVDISRIKVGKRQEIETLFNEEAYFFAKYLRKERKEWMPRIVSLS